MQGGVGSVSPLAFKAQIARFAPQFQVSCLTLAGMVRMHQARTSERWRGSRICSR